MAVKNVKLTSTLTQAVSLFYRVGTGEKSSVVEISLPPRAVLFNVRFASEEHFAAFKAQNAALIESNKIMLDGKLSATRAEKIHYDNAAKEAKQISAKKDAVVEQFEQVASNGDTKMKIDVQKG